MTHYTSAVALKQRPDFPVSAMGAPALARCKSPQADWHSELAPPPGSDTPEVELAARDQVVVDHLHLVKVTASSIRKSLPVHVDFDDLVQAGMVGLLDAANKYNSEKATSFPTYAKHRIRGAILDSLRQLDWATRDMRRRQKVVGSAIEDLAASLQRTPSENEVAEKAGMDLETCRQTMRDLHNGAPISASHLPTSEDLPAPQFPCGPEMLPDFICGREQLRGFLDQAIQSLPERYRKVVVMYYMNDMSMKEIGTALGIVESRVSQIHKAALAKMAERFQANGINSPWRA